MNKDENEVPVIAECDPIDRMCPDLDQFSKRIAELEAQVKYVTEALHSHIRNYED